MADPRSGPPPQPASGDAATVAEGVPDPVAATGTVGRRSFFRQLAGELIQTAGSLSGVATIAQGAVAGASAAASELGIEREAPAAGVPPAAAVAPAAAPPMVLAAGASIEPWTWDGDRLLLLDARRLPGAGPAFAVTSASSSARAIAARVVSGPTAAALAAWGLAFATEAAAGREATTGAALLRGSRSSMLAADPGSWVLRRTLATLPDAPGRGDAAAVTARLRTAHQTLAARLAGVLRDAGIRAPLLHGECGPLWGAGSGVGVEAIVGLLAGAPGPEVAPAVPPTADVAPGEVAAAARAAPAAPPSATTGAAVWVTEGRPWLTGARVTAWELGRLGCAATVVPDAAAATVLLERRVDALVMVAERSALDGTLALPVGALGLAVAAARARIPVIVARPDWALDPDARDAADLAEPPVADAALTHLGGTRITPPDAAVHAPRLDRVPADLVTHLVDQGAPTA